MLFRRHLIQRRMHIVFTMQMQRNGFAYEKDWRKVSKENVFVHGKWVCSREGWRARQLLECLERKRPPREETRLGCQAIVIICCDWKATNYVVAQVDEPNHPLEEPYSAHFLLSHRLVSNADKSQVKAMLKVELKTSQIMDFIVHQAGGYVSVDFTRKYLQNHIDA